MFELPIINLTHRDNAGRLEEIKRKLSLDDVLLGRQHAASLATVQQMIAAIKDRGDEAVAEFAARFDDPGITVGTLRVPQKQVDDAFTQADPQLIAALRVAIENVRHFQSAMLPADAKAIVPTGADPHGNAQLRIRSVPLNRVGIYVPGGAGAYPSTLIMTAVPAQQAGVKSLCVCSPAKGGRVAPQVLVAAKLLGIGEIFGIGGAQAIAAMALGTHQIKRVDKIVGPGNWYVQLAKRELFGMVDIDSFAGPSEVIVLADSSADPSVVAAELLAQAEHAPGSCILITADADFAAEVQKDLGRQLAALPRRELTEKALSFASAIVVTADHASALALTNELAPEHLQISTRSARDDAEAITNAGAIFIGHYSPVAAGDYLSGPSHVLPTSGTGRFFSGLSAESFRRRMSVVELDAGALKHVIGPLGILARAEGFEGHARSAEMRLPKPRSN
jgi:histidinol dehydrogenase